MKQASLRTLTWATVSAAVLSAGLLASAGDAGLTGWQIDEPGAAAPGLITRKPVRVERPLRSVARPGSAPVPRR